MKKMMGTQEWKTLCQEAFKLYLEADPEVVAEIEPMLNKPVYLHHHPEVIGMGNRLSRTTYDWIEFVVSRLRSFQIEQVHDLEEACRRIAFIALTVPGEATSTVNSDLRSERLGWLWTEMNYKTSTALGAMQIFERILYWLASPRKSSRLENKVDMMSRFWLENHVLLLVALIGQIVVPQDKKVESK